MGVLHTEMVLALVLLLVPPHASAAWGNWWRVTHLQPLSADAAVAQQAAAVTERVRLTPSDNLQVALTAHPAGTTFVLAPGQYRLDGRTPGQIGLQLRPNTTLVSEEPRSAVLSGSRLVSPYQHAGKWVVDGLNGLYNQSLGVCDPFHPACNLSQELFHNGARIKRLQSPADLGDEVNAWALDYATGIAILGFDPTGAPLEISTVMTAVSGNCLGGPCTGINVSGLVLEHFANPAQIMPTEGADIVENCEVRFCHGTGIGSRVMARNYVHHMGELGLGRDGGKTHSVVEGNIVVANTQAGFDCGWECGGAKFVAPSPTGSLMVRDNVFAHNLGVGLWTDCDSVNVVIEGNTILNNTGSGIRHEISFGALIRNNHVEGNCRGDLGHPWRGGIDHPNFGAWCGQITLSTSSDTVVEWNTVVGVGQPGMNNGITATLENRGSGAFGRRLLANVTVHHNTIVAETCGSRNGVVDLWNGTGRTLAQLGVHFDYNKYLLAGLVWEMLPGVWTNGFWWAVKTPGLVALRGQSWEDFRRISSQEEHGQAVLLPSVGRWCEPAKLASA